MAELATAADLDGYADAHPETNAPLTEALTDLVNDYRLDIIVRLTENAPNYNGNE